MARHDAALPRPRLGGQVVHGVRAGAVRPGEIDRRVDQQRRERVAARHVQPQRRGRQVVADGAQDRGAERSRVEPGAEPAGEVDQLAEEPLRVAVGGERVGEVPEAVVDRPRDQPDAQAGDAPGQRAEDLLGRQHAVRRDGHGQQQRRLGTDRQQHAPPPPGAGRR